MAGWFEVVGGLVGDLYGRLQKGETPSGSDKDRAEWGRQRDIHQRGFLGGQSFGSGRYADGQGTIPQVQFKRVPGTYNAYSSGRRTARGA
jgi:hypothetical protein